MAVERLSGLILIYCYQDIGIEDVNDMFLKQNRIEDFVI